MNSFMFMLFINIKMILKKYVKRINSHYCSKKTAEGRTLLNQILIYYLFKKKESKRETLEQSNICKKLHFKIEIIFLGN